MGGPYYVVEAAVIFKADPELLPKIEKAMAGPIAKEFKLNDAGFMVNDKTAEHGFYDVGYGFAPWRDDDIPEGSMAILFSYESPQSEEGREELVAAALNERFPGIEAVHELWGETW